jgi:uncharacterized protein (TIGR02099 family)
MLTRLLRFLATTLVVLLALCALLLGSARLFVPYLGSYRDDIATLASRTLHRDVTIHHMQATWRGLSPVLKLAGVRIASREHPEQRLDIGELWVRVDLRDVLLTRTLRLAGLDFVNTDFTVVRAADGHVYVKEFQADPQAVPPDLSALARLSLRGAGITFLDEQRGRPALHFRDVSLVLRNHGDRHDVSGRAGLPDSLGHLLEVEAHLQGTTPNPLDWQGQVYLRGQDLHVAGIMARLVPDAQPLDGQADVRLWAAVDAGTPVSLSGELDVSDFVVQSGHGRASAALQARYLRAQLGWQRRVHGWQAALQRFRMESDGQLWNMDNLSVAALTRDQTTILHAIASHLPLQEMNSLVAVLPGLGKDLRRQLLALHPTGVLENTDLYLRQLPDALVVDRFSTTFHDFGIAQSGAIPGIDGLNGSLQGTPTAGRLVLEGSGSHLADTRLFRAPLQFDHLRGDLLWLGNAEHLTFHSDSLHLDNAHLAADGKLQLALPRAGGAPILHLQLALPRLQISAVHEYLPVHVMSPVGVRWLDRSLVGGEVHDGTVLIDGPLDKLPFDHGEGRLEVHLPVTGATLDYNKHWSPVENLDAQVDINGRRLDVLSRQGRIRSAALHDVHAQILDLQHPHLTVTGDVSGRMAVMMQELGSSPLGDTYGGFVDRVRTTGNTALHLDIHVPLHKDEPVTVAGRIDLKGNSLELHDSDIKLTAMHGRLDFSEHGISGKGLKARLFNHPVRARVWTDAKRHSTGIELDGRLGLIDRVLPKDAALRAAVHGNPDWQVVLTLRSAPARGQRADLGLELRSTLAGTAIDLPAPLGKPAESSRVLSLRIDDLAQVDRELRVRYGDVLDGVLRLHEDPSGMHLQRGTLTFGGPRPRLPDSNVLLLTGTLAQFRLADWKPWLDKGGTGAAAVPLRVRVKIGDLDLFGQHIHDTGLDMHAVGRTWYIKATGAQLDGNLRVTRGKTGVARIGLDLNRLQLQHSPAAGPQATSTLRPADFPNLQASIRSLIYDKVNFGAVQLEADRKPDGRLAIRKASLDSPMLALNLTGEWYEQDKQDKHARSRIDLKVTGGKLGTLLDALGYEKIVKGGDLYGGLQATWPGAPWEAHLAKMDGKLSVVIKNGQLLDVEPGATGRALGLLSLGKLPRRLLMLDFTDLFGKGFGFDRIGGDFILDSGNAWTDNLEVSGPAAKIAITGRAGLEAQDYDEVVTVTPSLNSSLPIAGAIAGGPAVGAAVIVAEKLLHGRIGLNEMGRKQYRVTGTWSDPVIKRLTPETAAQEKNKNAQEKTNNQ